MPKRYDPNTKAKAVRLVREHAGDYPTEYAAISAVAGRLGMAPETLRQWLRQADVDEGKTAGTSTAESVQVRELKRKNRELEQTIEILKAATGFFAREYDPRQSLSAISSTRRKMISGSYRSAVRCRCTGSRSPRVPTGHTCRMPRRRGNCGMRQ
jgi:transposase